MNAIKAYWAAFLADYREQQLRRRLGHYIVDLSKAAYQDRAADSASPGTPGSLTSGEPGHIGRS